VHHVAFRAGTRAEQDALRTQVLAAGLDATPVLDRRYFQSVYFREPGGVLFESATDEPGFTVDEPPEDLGTRLQLPPWLEGERAIVERRLGPVHLPGRSGS
jgi:glyoxalase family protein